ncbi:MAG: DUF3343 domain-containing protein [Blautia sp.]|nr:DUF3343 domain-containing protein [Blautia sp.]
MRSYIATFYSHFGAVRFRRECLARGNPAKMMPVPRALSSSCGTCVAFEAEEAETEDPYGEIEQIVEIADGKYIPIYKAENL